MMMGNCRPTKKLTNFFLFLFSFVLTILLAVAWVNAKDTSKPKPEPWQINGIEAALDDGYPQVKSLAFRKLAEYNLQDLKSLGKKPEDFARKAANILKDKNVN